MNDKKRLATIERFIHSEKYLKGLPFRVLISPDQVTVQFKGISKEQMKKLRKNLNDAACDHIRITNLDKHQQKKDKKKDIGTLHRENDVEN